MRKLLVRKNKDKKYVAAITTIELVLILVILICLLYTSPSPRDTR